MFFSKKAPHDTGCMTIHLILAVLFFLATLASLMGAVFAHIAGGSFVFGTANGSLSLLAFAVTGTLWFHQMKCCMTSCEVCKRK